MRRLGSPARRTRDGLVQARAGRLAVEGAVAPRRRRALHAAVQRALAQTGDLSRRAYHAEEAGDSAAVLELAPGAAQRAQAASAHREAAAQYARALRHADGLDPAAHAGLLSAYGDEARLIGGFPRPSGRIARRSGSTTSSVT